MTMTNQLIFTAVLALLQSSPSLSAGIRNGHGSQRKPIETSLTCPAKHTPEDLFDFNNLIIEVETERAGIDNPNLSYGLEESQKNAALKAEKCLDLTQLTPDYSVIPEEYSCLPAYCEAITTAEECQAAFYKGCSYCSGSCVAAAAIQKAVIDCVREAYSDAEPNKVNGKYATPQDGEFVASEEVVRFQNMAGLSTLDNVKGGEDAVMYWGVYEDSRPPTKRVPIHVHPLGGFTCVNKGPVAMEIEGAPTASFKDGQCFTMPAFTKMTQAPPHDGYTVTDTFNVHSCLPTWVVIEEAAYHVQDEQFGISSDLVCSAQESLAVAV
jgi:hypothetical protein